MKPKRPKTDREYREAAERAIRVLEQSIATLKDQVHDGRVRSASVQAFWARAIRAREAMEMEVKS